MTEVVSPGPSSQPMRADIGLLHQLAEVLDASRLTMIEVRHGARKVRLVREASMLGVHRSAVPATVDVPLAGSADDPGQQPAAAASTSETIKSPIVGTVSLAKQDGAELFVTAGQKVKAGDTLLVIEAMKVKNPVVARKNGTVSAVLVEHGWPVEYDQPLMVME